MQVQSVRPEIKNKIHHAITHVRCAQYYTSVAPPCKKSTDGGLKNKPCDQHVPFPQNYIVGNFLKQQHLL